MRHFRSYPLYNTRNLNLKPQFTNIIITQRVTVDTRITLHQHIITVTIILIVVAVNIKAGGLTSALKDQGKATLVK